MIWQTEDIRGGLVVGRLGRLEQWLIAYVVPITGPNMYQLVSYNGDGLVACEPMSQEQMAARLNEHGEWPIELIDALDDAMTIGEAVAEEIAACR